MKALTKLASIGRRLFMADRDLDDIKIAQGQILEELHVTRDYSRLSDYEFKIFSQWGEDGIIAHLIRNIDIANKAFVEFGVETFVEANCRYLLQRGQWRGMVIDGSESNMARLRASYFFWRYPLHARASFITRENIDLLLRESGFERDLGILSVDIDGVDYHVLEALDAWQPRILIVEFNGLFGYDRAVSVPYAADFVRGAQHFSNQYYGASLPAFIHLANARGMALVGVNSSQSNAFFVRRTLLNDRIRETPLDQVRGHPVFREGRNASGKLTFAGPSASRAGMADMALIDVITGQTLRVGDLPDDPAR